jgi:hypothetical protein
MNRESSVLPSLISSKISTLESYIFCAGIAEPVQRWLDQTAGCSRHIQEDAILISQGKLGLEVSSRQSQFFCLL